MELCSHLAGVCTDGKPVEVGSPSAEHNRGYEVATGVEGNRSPSIDVRALVGEPTGNRFWAYGTATGKDP